MQNTGNIKKSYESADLKLDKVTPVIKHLFSECNIREIHSSEGVLLKISIPDEKRVNVYMLTDSLRFIGLEIEAFTMSQLEMLSKSASAKNYHYNFISAMIREIKRKINGESLTDAVIEGLDTYILGRDGNYTLSIEPLYWFAKHLDDGHNLKSMTLGRSFLHGEDNYNITGGTGQYLGENYSLSITPSYSVEIAEQIDSLLKEGKLDEVAEAIYYNSYSMIGGIKNSDIETQVKEKITKIFINN